MALEIQEEGKLRGYNYPVYHIRNRKYFDISEGTLVLFTEE